MHVHVHVCVSGREALYDTVLRIVFVVTSKWAAGTVMGHVIFLCSSTILCLYINMSLPYYKLWYVATLSIFQALLRVTNYNEQDGTIAECDDDEYQLGIHLLYGVRGRLF